MTTASRRRDRLQGEVRAPQVRWTDQEIMSWYDGFHNYRRLYPRDGKIKAAVFGQLAMPHDRRRVLNSNAVIRELERKVQCICDEQEVYAARNPRRTATVTPIRTSRRDNSRRRAA